MREDEREVDDDGDVQKEVPTKTLSKRVQTEKSKEVQAKHVSPPVKPYKPPVSYSQRLVKGREEHKYGKFFKKLKKFHMKISFLEAITDMSSYAKFLEDLFSNKGK